jgi:hypothetical protein
MAKQQTFITILKDENDKTINFERWGYKKLETVKKKLVAFYKDMMGYSYVQEELNKTKYIQFDQDMNGNNKDFVTLKKMKIEDFINLISK